MGRTFMRVFSRCGFLFCLLPGVARGAEAAETIQRIIVTVEGANDEWTPTPVDLSMGDLLIAVSKGTVTIGKFAGTVGPDGRPDGVGALQMKIGTTNVRTVGTRAIVQDQQGVVKLRVQDSAYNDNHGAFRTELIRIPVAMIPPPRVIGDRKTGMDGRLALDLIEVVNANPLGADAAMALENACRIFERTSSIIREATECRARLQRDYSNGKPSADLLTKSYVKREVVRSPGVKECYERALRRNPSIGGDITLGWTIVPDGSVRNVSVTEDTFHDADMLSLGDHLKSGHR